MKQIGDHIFAETAYSWANVGAAVTDAGIVLLDCPVRPSDSKKWLEALHPLSPLGPRYLIGTDFHGDHTTGAAFVPDVVFIALRLVYRELADSSSNAFSKKIFFETLRDEGHTEEAEQIEKAVVPLPHICFDETLLLNLHPFTFEIRRLGGHSPACSVVHIPEEGILFASDVVINDPSPGMRDANIAEWIAALTWIDELPVDTIVPGHGDICGKEVVRRLINRFEEMRGIMNRLIQSGLSKTEAMQNDLFEKFFFGDTSRGNYWLQQRRTTFREGLERLYDEVKGY
ncbi:MAG: MBL fold metallo-hydrolase [Desulfobacterales bacterium]|nr:MBL fold metallo-hydrolase [Desulfobacterales bacterium]